jgi:hypothetical protein
MINMKQARQEGLKQIIQAVSFPDRLNLLSYNGIHPWGKTDLHGIASSDKHWF